MSSVGNAVISRTYGTAAAAWFAQVTIMVFVVFLAIVTMVTVAAVFLDVYALVQDSLSGSFEGAHVKKIFAHIILALIALELCHSLIHCDDHMNFVFQIKAILLMALLAVLRKLMVLDYSHAGAEVLIGLAVSALVLCWAFRTLEKAG
jgi:uncharacterized membrane protein (DUF373 family)